MLCFRRASELSAGTSIFLYEVTVWTVSTLRNTWRLQGCHHQFLWYCCLWRKIITAVVLGGEKPNPKKEKEFRYFYSNYQSWNLSCVDRMFKQLCCLRCLIQLLAPYMFMEENLKLIPAIFCLQVKSIVEQADLESTLSWRSFLRVTYKLKHYQREKKQKSISNLKCFLFQSCRMLILWD